MLILFVTLVTQAAIGLYILRVLWAHLVERPRDSVVTVEQQPLLQRQLSMNMNYVCIKMSEPVPRSMPLDSYFQRLVVGGGGSPMACRRVATFPLTSDGMGKSSSLIGRSQSEPKGMNVSGLQTVPAKHGPFEEELGRSTEATKLFGCKLSGVKPKKSVTFADDRGCPLATITVMTEPSDVPPRINSAVLRALGVTEDYWNADSAHPKCTWRVEFPQPASDYTKFRSKVARQNVAVENVLVDNEHRRVSGIVKVKNIAFEKSVMVRYTMDNWRTFYDRLARYLRSAGSDFDTFQFEFDLPEDNGECHKVDFCVCYKAGDAEYWDNNDNSNFELSSESLRNSRTQLSSQAPDGDLNKGTAYQNCSDAFLLNHPNWTEFASWSDLSNNSPYW